MLVEAPTSLPRIRQVPIDYEVCTPMILTCPACETRYSVDPNSLLPSGRTVRCARCGNSWHEVPPGDMPRSVAPMMMQEAEPDEDSDFDVPSIEDMTVQAARPTKRMVRTARSKAKPKRNLGALAAWGSFAVVVLGIFGGGVFGRGMIMEAWPPSTKLYELVGLGVPKVYALALGSIAPAQEMDGETRVIVVTGVITNTTDERQTIPKLRGALLDARQPPREIFTWTFEAPAGEIEPRGTREFATRVPNPPAAARGVAVTFAVDG